MSEEGRRFKRLGANWIVRIRTQKPTDSSRIRMNERIKNISLGGVFIETSYPFPAGSFVEFDFNLPGHPDMIHARGIVKWVNDGRYQDQPRGMGVEFVEVTTASQSAIEGFVETTPADNLLAPLLTTDDHKAILAFYKQKVGETFQVETLAKFTSIPPERLVPVLSDFAIFDLVSVQGPEIRFKTCADPALKASIDAWTGG